MELTAKEIYILGKAVVDENREIYYGIFGNDVISAHPDKLIRYLNMMIENLERVRYFAEEYQKTLEEDESDDY